MDKYIKIISTIIIILWLPLMIFILIMMSIQPDVESSFPKYASTQINTPAKIPIYDSQEYKHPSDDTIENFTQEVTG